MTDTVYQQNMTGLRNNLNIRPQPLRIHSGKWKLLEACWRRQCCWGRHNVHPWKKYGSTKNRRRKISLSRIRSHFDREECTANFDATNELRGPRRETS